MNLSKILSKRMLLMTVLTGLAVFSALLFYFISKSSIRSNSVAPTANATNLYGQTNVNSDANSDLPIRLIIPNINVDAAVDYVGLTSDGAMDVPTGPTTTAWLDLGPRPGDSGSAVIDGHEGWKDGTQAVFDNLYKLQNGDKIYVEDKAGVTTTFVVRETQTYGENQDFSNVFRSSDGKAHLNLITCAGAWNKTQKSYSNRLVIFTDKEIE
jgi:LPXTG-site transpeptidase (sortase) family protein